VADDGHQITFVLMDRRVFVSGVSLGAVLSGLPLPEKIYSFGVCSAGLSTPIHWRMSISAHINRFWETFRVINVKSCLVYPVGVEWT